MVASPQGTPFFDTRLMVGFGELNTEPPLLLSVLKEFWDWELSLPFECSLLLIRRSLMITLVASHSTGNFSSGITLLHNITLCCWYLAPSGVDTTYDLGLLSPGLDITVAGCHRLTLGDFGSHIGSWSGSGGSSLTWASCQAYFFFLRRLLQYCLCLR